jgi:hypothetical protein
MNMPRALVSSFTSINDQFQEDHLKLCFLWYDEVLFETIGTYDEKRFFERLVKNEADTAKTIRSLTDVIVPLGARVAVDLTDDLVTLKGHTYPRWGKQHENYTYPEPENAEEFAHNRLLEHIAQEHGVSRFNDGWEIEQAEGRARVATDAILLWERVNAELPCMLQTNSDEKLAMTAAQQFSDGLTLPGTPFSLFEATIPSLAQVSWTEVVRLRKQGSLELLRQKIGQAVESAGTDLELAKSLFNKAETQAIEAIVDTNRPRVKRIAIESILSNLPGLPINPFSVLFGLRDTAKSYTRNKDFGWLYLLRDIRRSATPTG